MNLQLKRLSVAVSGAALLMAAGCGGGGDSGSDTPTSGTTLNGVATKGPLKGVLVTAYPVNDAGVVGDKEIAHASTDTTAATAGAYTLALGTYAGTVQLVVTAPAGSTSADETTGQDVPLPSTFTLHANTVVAASTGTQTQSASITPYTELAHSIAKGSGGLTAGNIANSNGVVFALIGVDPVATRPLASNAAPGADATDAPKRYALFNAAVSKMASSAPQTTDTTTLACFSAAGADLGKKIQCVTEQIAGSVTVTGNGAQAVASVNNRLVGLSAALVSVAADSTINKTGTTIATTDSAVKTLDSLEAAAVHGTQTPVSGGTSPQGRTDVATAKAFFSGLRSNAAALQSDSVSTGIVDGVKAFGDSLKGEATALTSNTVQVVELAQTATKLWTNYKNGSTINPNSPAVPGSSNLSGCTLYQGSFPTRFGPADAPLGTQYVSTSVVASTPANASWAGCSVNSALLLANGTPRYRQTLLIDMSTDPTLARVPYLAITRSQFVTGGVAYQKNLTPALGGTALFTTTNGEMTAISLVGDLPPATKPTGELLAQRYAVNFAGALTPMPSGATQATFSHGSLGVVAVGAADVGLVIDLSVGGASFAVIPQSYQDAAQLAARKFSLAASITDARGRLTGTFLVDQFSRDSSGDLVPAHVKFTGEAAVAPVVNGSTTGVVSFLSGTLEATNGVTPVVSFSGSLTLPNRPATTLTGSITETAADVYTLEGRYVQAGTTVTINGSKSATGTTATFADSTGVSVSVTNSTNKANVTVTGRQTAVIDKDAKIITYSDGTFESLI